MSKRGSGWYRDEYEDDYDEDDYDLSRSLDSMGHSGSFFDSGGYLISPSVHGDAVGARVSSYFEVPSTSFGSHALPPEGQPQRQPQSHDQTHGYGDKVDDIDGMDDEAEGKEGEEPCEEEDEEDDGVFGIGHRMSDFLTGDSHSQPHGEIEEARSSSITTGRGPLSPHQTSRLTGGMSRPSQPLPSSAEVERPSEAQRVVRRLKKVHYHLLTREQKRILKKRRRLEETPEERIARKKREETKRTEKNKLEKKELAKRVADDLKNMGFVIEERGKEETDRMEEEGEEGGGESSKIDIVDNPEEDAFWGVSEGGAEKMEFADDGLDDKEHLNVVVVGHVDAGKSTLMGHLLYNVGNVAERDIRRFQKESDTMGKGSFSYAWVMDEQDEERSRGVTMDVSVRHFETEHRRITILDAPGHQDFIPNMITGAAQADSAILVISAQRGDFESGFGDGGRTREHAMIVRSMGINELIVVINKMDTVEWSQERLKSIIGFLSKFLKQIGFSGSNVKYVPCDAFHGVNLTEIKDKSSLPVNASWMSDHDSLLEAIDHLQPVGRVTDYPMRMCISDLCKIQQLSGTVVGGKLESGEVKMGDRLICMPNAEICQVKHIDREGKRIRKAYAGDNIELVVACPKPQMLTLSSVLCSKKHPIAVCRHFEANVMTFGSDVPITKGTNFVLHVQNTSVPAYVEKFIAILGKGSSIETKNPRILIGRVSAAVVIRSKVPICLEEYTSIRSLGRFILRSGDVSVAAGVVTKIIA